MSGRTAGRLALVLAGLAGLLFATAVGLYAAGDGFESSRLFSLVFLVVFSVLGFLVASRHPGNAIGWIFCGCAVLSGLSTLADAYANYWLDGHGAAGLGRAAAAYETAAWPALLIPVTFLLLLFPTGRLLSPRWRWVGWCAGLGIAGAFATSITAPGRLEDYPGVENPLGVEGWVPEAAMGLAALMLLIAVVGSPASLVLRLRRSAGLERQQVKWLMWAGAVAGVTFLVGSTAGYEYAGPGASNAAILTGMLMLPLATGIAILRYRLFDIDVVINRTLVYTALTVTLAAAYLASVLLLQLVLGALTSDSGIAVAGSTLAVAALFRPARARIQAAVDRRFYRRRYDAQRTLESFSARLRDQVELGALNSELRAVVSETLQPAHVSLWLRSPEAG
jgi:MFS family permease